MIYERFPDCINCNYTLTNVSNFSNYQFSIYPNPITNISICKFPQGINPIRYSIFDFKGNIIDNSTISNPNDFVLDKEDIGIGIFILEIIDENGKAYRQKILTL